MNILVLSAGTRCQLINYFKQSGNGFDKVIATDCSIYAPAIYMADEYYIVPRMKEDEYLPTLLKICKQESINVILPLQEDELELIAENKKKFEQLGILVSVSSLNTVKICRDKYLLFRKMKDLGIKCVDTYDYDTEKNLIDEQSLPVMVKERRGSGSIGNFVIKNRSLLQYYAENTGEKLVVQPYMNAQEFGVDVYIDFISREVISIFAKEKLRMRAGETEKSKSVKDDRLYDFIKNVVEKMNFLGPIDIDVFKYEGEYYILEINPRFGGGYPHAYECGVNFVKYIASNARGQKLVPQIGNYKENEVMLKYTDVLLKSENEMGKLATNRL